jgi:hypothetical protein
MQVVRHKYCRLSEIADEVCKFLLQFGPGYGVEGSERFIQQNYLWVSS